MPGFESAFLMLGLTSPLQGKKRLWIDTSFVSTVTMTSFNPFLSSETLLTDYSSLLGKSNSLIVIIYYYRTKETVLFLIQ